MVEFFRGKIEVNQQLHYPHWKLNVLLRAIATKDAMWIKRLTKDIAFHQLGHIPLYCNNYSCIALSRNLCHHNRSKNVQLWNDLNENVAI